MRGSESPSLGRADISCTYRISVRYQQNRTIPISYTPQLFSPPDNPWLHYTSACDVFPLPWNFYTFFTGLRMPRYMEVVALSICERIVKKNTQHGTSSQGFPIGNIATCGGHILRDCEGDSKLLIGANIDRTISTLIALSISLGGQSSSLAFFCLGIFFSCI